MLWSLLAAWLHVLTSPAGAVSACSAFAFAASGGNHYLNTAHVHGVGTAWLHGCMLSQELVNRMPSFPSLSRLGVLGLPPLRALVPSASARSWSAIMNKRFGLGAAGADSVAVANRTAMEIMMLGIVDLDFLLVIEPALRQSSEVC